MKSFLMRTLAVLLPFLVLSLLPPPARAAEAARVNGKVISEGAVSLELARDPELRYHPNLTAAKLAVYRKAALQRLVEQEVCFSEAVRQRAAPSVAAVAEGVARGEKGMGGREKLVADLAKGGLTLADYEDWIRKSTAFDALAAKVKGDVSVAPGEVAAYYAARETEYVQPARVTAAMLYFPLAPYATTAETAALKGKAAQAAARWREAKPGTEAELAQATGAKYQVMGDVHQGAAIAGLDEALFALDAGAVSEPIQTIYGFHVLRVSEKKPSRKIPLVEASDGIRSKLLKQKGEAQLSRLIAKLMAEAKIEMPK